MTERGEVYKLGKKNRAIVRFPRTTACKNCNMCFKPRDEMFVEVTVENVLHAGVGDTVAVSMGQKAVLGASLIVYLIPVVLVGAILALTYRIDEVLSFVFAGVGLVLAEVLIALTDRVLRKRTEYLPKMVEIIRTDASDKAMSAVSSDAAPDEKKEVSGDAESENTVGATEDFRGSPPGARDGEKVFSTERAGRPGTPADAGGARDGFATGIRIGSENGTKRSGSEAPHKESPDSEISER